MAQVYLFVCRKCGWGVQGTSQPSTSGCPAGGTHSWTRTRLKRITGKLDIEY